MHINLFPSWTPNNNKTSSFHKAWNSSIMRFQTPSHGDKNKLFLVFNLLFCYNSNKFHKWKRQISKKCTSQFASLYSKEKAGFEKTDRYCFFDRLWYLLNRLFLWLALVDFGLGWSKYTPFARIMLSLARNRAASLLDIFCRRAIFWIWESRLIMLFSCWFLVNIKNDSTSPGVDCRSFPAINWRQTQAILNSFIFRKYFSEKLSVRNYGGQIIWLEEIDILWNFHRIFIPF